MASVNWRAYLAELVPGWLQRRWGERFVGALGLLADSTNTALAFALRATWLLDPANPEDILKYIGRERLMARFPGESAAAYRVRLHGAWDTWQFVHEDTIDAQLNLAGFNPTFRNNAQWEHSLPEEAEHWSRFWIILEAGNHTWTSDGTWGDSGTWGDDGVWGASMTVLEVQTIRQVVGTFKPVDWICPAIILIFSGELWGFPEGTWGDPGTWGAEVAILGAR